MGKTRHREPLTRPHSAVITGASSGIGKALAFELAARGYALGLASRRIARLEELHNALLTKHPGLKIELAELDVDQVDTVQASLDDLFARMGGADVVVVNAGVNRFTGVGRGQLEDELQILQTNVLGAVATIEAASAHFLSRGRGQLVGVSSLAAENPIPKQAAYCASKAALSMYLDIARMELSRKGIGVTTILPGFVETEIMEDIGKYPFAVSAEKAAREMADIIESGADIGVVPAFPWKYVKPFFKIIPDAVYRKLK